MNIGNRHRKPIHVTRRGFIGKISLVLGGIASLSLPLQNVLYPTKSNTAPLDNLPEDSIYKPRKQP